jgi:N-acyl-D-amino-acid deacylase
MNLRLKPAVCALFALVPLLGTAAPPEELRVREAVSRTLSLLERTTVQWKAGCFSCHHQGLVMMAQDAARRRGMPADESAARDHAARTLAVLSSVDTAVQSPLDVIGHGYGLLAAKAQNIGRNLVTAVYARRFLNQQRPDGHWPVNDVRPPHAYSKFTATALGARVLSLYLPEQYSHDRDASFVLARYWLLSNQPRSTEDRAFQLLGLTWSNATLSDRSRIAKTLLLEQQPDGGWAQVKGMESDAYSTGQALVALRQSGVIPAGYIGVQRGVRFLLDTQGPDGSWLVRTRLHSPVTMSPPYFESGFPHGRDQFISVAGSAWAIMGLLEEVPEIPSPRRALMVPEAQPANVEPWMRTALFGTAEDLRTLLANGLSANAASKGGTTLLMMAAADPEKIGILVENGANVHLIAKDGATALSVAAGYRGAAPVLRLLLDHGAKIGPAVTLGAGDLDAMSLLIANGLSLSPKSEVSSPLALSPLVNAAIGDDVEMIRLLVRKGADVNERDKDSVTPLMWAAIGHKTAATRALLELGADPNCVDRFGSTALRHTKDVDHADPQTADLIQRAIARRPAKSASR